MTANARMFVRQRLVDQTRLKAIQTVKDAQGT